MQRETVGGGEQRGTAGGDIGWKSGLFLKKRQIQTRWRQAAFTRRELGKSAACAIKCCRCESEINSFSVAFSHLLAQGNQTNIQHITEGCKGRWVDMKPPFPLLHFCGRQNLLMSAWTTVEKRDEAVQSHPCELPSRRPGPPGSQVAGRNQDDTEQRGAPSPFSLAAGQDRTGARETKLDYRRRGGGTKKKKKKKKPVALPATAASTATFPAQSNREAFRPRNDLQSDKSNRFTVTG